MTEDLEQELSHLSARLEVRHSVSLFAWSFGLGCVAFMGIGVAVKLFHDSARVPKVAFLLLAVGLGCAAVGFARLRKGLRLYGAELRDFERFVSVRHMLGLDRPQLPPA